MDEMMYIAIISHNNKLYYVLNNKCKKFKQIVVILSNQTLKF